MYIAVTKNVEEIEASLAASEAENEAKAKANRQIKVLCFLEGRR